MSKRYIILMALVSIMISIIPSVTAQDGIESVCLVTDLGRVNDGTFNEFAHNGAEEAADEFDLEYSFIETESETDYEANIQSCIDSGFEAVVTVGFLINDATAAAAAENPDIFFIGVDQSAIDMTENFVGIQYREDQSGFLAGVLAALVANDMGEDVIAGVYGMEVPAVVRFRNGYEQGALFVNPDWKIDTNILGTYSDSFIDQQQGISHANQFIGEGAAVIFGAGGPLGSAAIGRAAGQGIYVIGVDQDEYYSTFDEGAVEGAEFLITSAMKRVDIGVYDMIAVLAEGEYDDFPGADNYLLNLDNGGIEIAPPHDSDIDEAIYEEVYTVLDMLIEGEVETNVDPVSGDVIDDMDMMEEEETSD